jgi:type II secretory pathway pseudopilin PulG
MKKTLPGFVLLEVAIALSVLGVITYMAMPLLGKIQQWQQVRLTTAHQEKIVESLAGYVLSNKRLPCPALTSNGEAQSTCTNDTKVGFVPYKTLGIDEKTAKDGNHHWMTYAVQPSLASSRISCISTDPSLAIDPKTVFCKTPSDGNLAIQSANNQPCILAPDFVAVVLIAHGSSGGYGLDNGSIQPVDSTDVDKVRNAARLGVFTTKTQSRSTGAAFDDTLLYVSRNNLMAQWAKFPCRR